VSYTLAFALQLRKKHGKTSARVAAHTTQADKVQYTEEKHSCLYPQNVFCMQVAQFHQWWIFTLKLILFFL
jgi:hypothetical protein